MIHDLSRTISRLHFGDLHITAQDQPNYRDFLALIEDANENIADGIDFAVLPGDNADDGTPEQYASIRRAIAGLRLPLEIRTGDHDRKTGTLQAYQAALEPQLWRHRIVGRYRCLFLNSLDGTQKHSFDLGPEQRAWFVEQCEAAQRNSQTLALFMHAYPSEHGASAHELRAAIARYPVAVVRSSQLNRHLRHRPPEAVRYPRHPFAALRHARLMGRGPRPRHREYRAPWLLVSR